MSYDEHLISMAGGDWEADVLGEIEARDKAVGPLSKQPHLSESHEALLDRRALLAMVREQRARLDAATVRLDEWASYKAFPDAEESQRWYSLGKRHAADAIRSALTKDAS